MSNLSRDIVNEKVFILYYSYDYGHIGVYSTREKAEKAKYDHEEGAWEQHLLECKKENCENELTFEEHYKDKCYISEVEVE